jgi:hypothetical protein
MLEPLGLSSTANRIYCALRDHPGQGGENLASALAMPATDIADGVAELVSLGLADAGHPGPETPVTVVSPLAAANILIARQESDLSEAMSRIAQSRIFAAQLSVREASTSISAVDAESVFGKDAIIDTLRTLSCEAENEVATFAPGGAQSSESIASSRGRNEEMFGQGVYSRSVYLTSMRNDPATRANVQWLNERGAEVRTVPILPIRMIIADRRVAVVPIDPGNGMNGIIVHRSPGTVAALQALFKAVWDSASPLGERPLRDSHDLSAEEKAILELLVLDKDDVFVGHSLGMSARSARRRIDALKERLGNKSWFVAGYQAVKNGWL